ncbi:MAG TPA: GDP-mannose 4,6-dehydratase, partial [Gemmatimonadaceae bacterium]|nr:GDP-mannose 4,6-dehydratase [Gemmatimonadaceae bacterium]
VLRPVHVHLAARRKQRSEGVHLLPVLIDVTSNGRTALICGVSGQDGAYLSQLLLEKGYIVHGASRDAQASSFRNLRKLGLIDSVRLESLNITDFRSVIQALQRVNPDEVYNLAGQSSVALSFDQPVETLESISVGTLNLLEAIRFSGRPIRFYNAGSGECFGDTPMAADESTAFRPRSPYAVAKSAAHWEVANYADAYGLFACTGILFNHESPLRAERFVTRKIVAAACRISQGSRERLSLGNLRVQRDWGWAPEYVEAMWMMLQQEKPENFVIATGQSHTLAEFVERAFREVGLEWRDHVDTDEKLFRPADITYAHANPARANERLGWKAKAMMPDVVAMMTKAQLAETSS